jgi:hypothetical protein
VHVVTDFESSPRRLTLSRPFGDLLMELSIALQKFAIYPDGHPSLEPAAASIVRRCERVLEDRDLVAIGVARYQLIIEGVATDPNQPVLRRLASALKRLTVHVSPRRARPNCGLAWRGRH